MIFLNITPTVTNWTSDNKQFSLIFEENPLADFVELPDDGRAQDELWYSNILCGILRGALEMVSHTFVSPSNWSRTFRMRFTQRALRVASFDPSYRRCVHIETCDKDALHPNQSPCIQVGNPYAALTLTGVGNCRYRCKSRPTSSAISFAATTAPRCEYL